MIAPPSPPHLYHPAFLPPPPILLDRPTSNLSSRSICCFCLSPPPWMILPAFPALFIPRSRPRISHSETHPAPCLPCTPFPTPIFRRLRRLPRDLWSRPPHVEWSRNQIVVCFLLGWGSSAPLLCCASVLAAENLFDWNKTSLFNSPTPNSDRQADWSSWAAKCSLSKRQQLGWWEMTNMRNIPFWQTRFPSEPPFQAQGVFRISFLTPSDHGILNKQQQSGQADPVRLVNTFLQNLKFFNRVKPYPLTGISRGVPHLHTPPHHLQMPAVDRSHSLPTPST